MRKGVDYLLSHEEAFWIGGMMCQGIEVAEMGRF